MNLQSDKVFYYCKPVLDTEAFKDAQLMARIAVNNLSTRIPADALWFAAMQTLKAAYAGEQK
ncbi:TPA_asm: hypothetical protein GI617_22925 [Salmonella enterica subsp. enterica serovar Enteritidis]|uniref:Uncharacterized protein n=1 Tax=Salmonella enteritidis TaxID=149539 RepID=A0A6X9JX74_SALEN|nr:hypothetical protein [Salmonella enterica subsp. enterica serovar Enteritidis]HAB2629683.1 hypothetical protein [Salmonella enterica subsp. enterica serovar Enteritidis]